MRAARHVTAGPIYRTPMQEADHAPVAAVDRHVDKAGQLTVGLAN
jgi:hypothetical protein